MVKMSVGGRAAMVMMVMVVITATTEDAEDSNHGEWLRQMMMVRRFLSRPATPRRPTTCDRALTSGG